VGDPQCTANKRTDDISDDEACHRRAVTHYAPPSPKEAESACLGLVCRADVCPVSTRASTVAGDIEQHSIAIITIGSDPALIDGFRSREAGRVLEGPRRNNAHV